MHSRKMKTSFHFGGMLILTSETSEMHVDNQTSDKGTCNNFTLTCMKGKQVFRKQKNCFKGNSFRKCLPSKGWNYKGPRLGAWVGKLGWGWFGWLGVNGWAGLGGLGGAGGGEGGNGGAEGR